MRSTATITLADLLALSSREGRVCPQPGAWHRLYDLLPGKRHDAYGSSPAAPLILDAWAQASDEQKRERFVEHLQWAQAHGALQAVHAMLSQLMKSEWHHVGE
jgi:hypothetical protein